VALTGQLDADLLGNSADNTLRGNLGNNLLDGGEGQDTAVYCVPLDELLLEQQENGDWQVQGPEGTDTLRDVEWVRATDGELTL
jgi:Ca2+-binding RTX toxin-like protein